MRTLSLIVATALISACGPSINPELQASLDAWKKQLDGAGGNYGPAGMMRPDFAVGQWAEYLQTDKEGRPSRIKYKIVGEEDGGHWMEVESTDYYRKSVSKMLMVIGDWKNPDTWEIKRMISQADDQQAQELPVFMTSAMVKPLLSSMQYDIQTESSTESVTVPAGTFEGAYKVRSEVTSPFGTHTSITWVHGKVPVTGYVRAHSEDDAWKTELVAFGDSGAETAITGEVQRLAF